LPSGPQKALPALAGSTEKVHKRRELRVNHGTASRTMVTDSLAPHGAVPRKRSAQPPASFAPNRHGECEASRRHPSPPRAAFNHGPDSHAMDTSRRHPSAPTAALNRGPSSRPRGTGSLKPRGAIPRSPVLRSATGQLHTQPARRIWNLTAPPLAPKRSAQPRANFTPNWHGKRDASRRHPSARSAALNHGPTSRPVDTGSKKPHGATPRPQVPRSSTGQLHAQWSRRL